MARRVSAPAFRTARVILQSYKMTVRPDTGAVGMTGGESHVAIVIDYATNVFKIAELRPELHYWQRQLTARRAEAPQLAGYLQKLIAAFKQVPQYGPKDRPDTVPMELLPQFATIGVPDAFPVSKNAEEVYRFLKHYYVITPMEERAFDAVEDRIQIVRIAASNLGLDHALKGLPLAELYLDRLKHGQATQKEIRNCFKNLGIFLESMPNYRDRKEEMMLVT
jgi:hypothetical protein